MAASFYDGAGIPSRSSRKNSKPNRQGPCCSDTSDKYVSLPRISTHGAPIRCRRSSPKPISTQYFGWRGVDAYRRFQNSSDGNPRATLDDDDLTPGCTSWLVWFVSARNGCVRRPRLERLEWLSC